MQYPCIAWNKMFVFKRNVPMGPPRRLLQVCGRSGHHSRVGFAHRIVRSEPEPRPADGVAAGRRWTASTHSAYNELWCCSHSWGLHSLLCIEWLAVVQYTALLDTLPFPFSFLRFGFVCVCSVSGATRLHLQCKLHLCLSVHWVTPAAPMSEGQASSSF